MRIGIGLCAAVALAAAGCESGSGKVAVHPVSGQVMYEGKAAVGVRVFLFPTGAPGIPEIPVHPHGKTGADGRFTISTYTEADGAAEGGYQVVLFWPISESEEDGETSKNDRLLGWYTAARSRLTLTVKPGPNELPVWNLPVVKVPPSESGGGIPGRN